MKNNCKLLFFMSKYERFVNKISVLIQTFKRANYFSYKILLIVIKNGTHCNLNDLMRMIMRRKLLLFGHITHIKNNKANKCGCDG